MRRTVLPGVLVLAALLATAACGGSKKSGATAIAPIAGATAAAAAATPMTIDQARALLARASLEPADLPAGWKVMSDTTTDNAAAAAADPSSAASNTRCGRLLGRTVADQPADPVPAFISGQTVSYFSSLTVYATAAGATDCSNEAAARYQQPGELAKAFGTLFTDPKAVVVKPVTFPATGDGSFAATLAGKVNVSGTIIDLTVLVVGFRKGNVTAVVGSAANEAPPMADLTPLVNLVLRRISAE
ncbi:MAG: hypothetical protein KGK07_08930 [Chloroflexota bacterium]|nr:hypothetical protein [Chloroflexota bacterium]